MSPMRIATLVIASICTALEIALDLVNYTAGHVVVPHGITSLFLMAAGVAWVGFMCTQHRDRLIRASDRRHTETLVVIDNLRGEIAALSEHLNAHSAEREVSGRLAAIREMAPAARMPSQPHRGSRPAGSVDI